MKFRWTLLMATAALAAVLGLAGCEGDDGPAGPQGDTGAQGDQGDPGPAGPAGQDALFKPVESCAVCHGATAIADASANHALPPIESVSGVTFAVAENLVDLEVTFNVAVDNGTGFVASDAYDTIQRGYRTDGTTRTTIVGDLTLANNTGGNYTITIAGGAAVEGNNRYLFRVAIGSDRDTRVYFYADYPESPFTEPAAVTAQACANCHGPEPISIHGSAFQATESGEVCLVCHGVGDIPSLGYVVHGVHNSSNHPDGEWIYNPEDAPEDWEIFHVTYPSYMNNCSVCHETAEQLASVNEMRVEPDACFSCHFSTETMFEPTDPIYTVLHEGTTVGCGTSCHVDNGAGSDYQTVTDVHNGRTTERSGIIWDGEDTSVTEGKLFDVRITGVDDTDGTSLTITWEADYNGVGVNPCNDTVGDNAPVFHLLPNQGSGGTWSILRNYAQGEDFILGVDPEGAGQPESENLTAENTTCDGFVATTVVPVEVDATYATVGRVGIQGKPAVVSVADPSTFMRVRAKSPTYDWVIGTADRAPDRRAIVDTTQKCLKCHVGSLYQHGGNRVDNIDLCILCHNSAANDKYVRVGMGVDASEAYDGQAGELFEMKTMLHAVHPSGHAEVPFVIYRGRGIYAWARDESLVPNWPTELDCVYGTNNTPGSTVFGSDPETATVRTCQPHTFHAPTYPRGLYDCGACHVDSFAMIFPDATKAMASTVDAGEGPDWSDLTDDVLEGASSASCMSCHKQFSAADRAEYNALGAHAAQNGWEPQAFPEGRQTIIDANE